jgi:UDP-N-acetylglucosamine--dolichyl-phosphate N-acetylglucosaminephosphotransferase
MCPEFHVHSKLILPMVAAMPLLVSYSGKTDIAIPKPLKALLQYGGCDVLSLALTQYGECDVIHLGVLYHFYMLLLTIFCTNSINILAGVNGLEAGQVIARMLIQSN